MKNSGNKEVKEIGLKSVFTFLINGLFSVFFISSGFINFKEKKIVAGLLYFVLAALALIPHRFLKVTQALKIVILTILFIILATLAAKGDPIAEQKYENYSLGQKFNLTYANDNFSMVVREAKNNSKISVSGKEVTTSGYFIIITGDIVNIGSEAAVFKFRADPELMDNKDRHYTLYGKGLTVGKLQPGVAKEVPYVFEIPKDATGLKFIVRDKTSIAKSVDLKR